MLVLKFEVARNVFLPRLPPPFAMLKVRMLPAALRGTRNRPGAVKVRMFWVTGSRISGALGSTLGRSPPAPLPLVSTPVRILNGCPDVAEVIPEICHPPKTRFRNPLLFAKPGVGAS